MNTIVPAAARDEASGAMSSGWPPTHPPPWNMTTTGKVPAIVGAKTSILNLDVNGTSSVISTDPSGLRVVDPVANVVVVVVEVEVVVVGGTVVVTVVGTEVVVLVTVVVV